MATPVATAFPSPDPDDSAGAPPAARPPASTSEPTCAAASTASTAARCTTNGRQRKPVGLRLQSGELYLQSEQWILWLFLVYQQFLEWQWIRGGMQRWDVWQEWRDSRELFASW